jgi:hypothetical protein
MYIFLKILTNFGFFFAFYQVRRRGSLDCVVIFFLELGRYIYWFWTFRNTFVLILADFGFFLVFIKSIWSQNRVNPFIFGALEIFNNFGCFKMYF